MEIYFWTLPLKSLRCNNNNKLERKKYIKSNSEKLLVATISIEGELQWGIVRDWSHAMKMKQPTTMPSLSLEIWLVQMRNTTGHRRETTSERLWEPGQTQRRYNNQQHCSLSLWNYDLCRWEIQLRASERLREPGHTQWRYNQVKNHHGPPNDKVV